MNAWIAPITRKIDQITALPLRRARTYLGRNNAVRQMLKFKLFHDSRRSKLLLAVDMIIERRDGYRRVLNHTSIM